MILQDAEDNRGGAFLERITLAEGVVDPSAMAKVLGITKRRLADAVGLPADAVHRKSRMYSGSTQAPLKELAEFMGLIVAWHESPAAAFRWYSGIPSSPSAEGQQKTFSRPKASRRWRPGWAKSRRAFTSDGPARKPQVCSGADHGYEKSTFIGGPSG